MMVTNASEVADAAVLFLQMIEGALRSPAAARQKKKNIYKSPRAQNLAGRRVTEGAPSGPRPPRRQNAYPW